MMKQPKFGSYTKCQEIPIFHPPQYQPQQPGIESIMIPRPISENCLRPSKFNSIEVQECNVRLGDDVHPVDLPDRGPDRTAQIAESSG